MNIQSDDHKFAHKVVTTLTIILFFKIVGYFTLTENIAITRVLKVLIRLSMTMWIISTHQKIVNRGNVSSMKITHTLSPFVYGLYLLLGFASLLWSTNPGYSMLQLVMNVESFIFTYLFIKTVVLLNHTYPEVNARLSVMFGPAACWILLMFLIGMFIDPETFYRLTHGGEEARLGGYLMNPNELGMLGITGMACNLVEITKNHRKGWQFVMMSVMLYAVIMTGSRSSMIALLLVIFYFITLSNNTKLKIAVVAGAILSIPVIVQTIFIKQGDIEEVMSMTGRLPFWKALLTEGLPKEPFLGFGYMRIAYTESFQSVHTYAGKMTHNTFIQVLMNLGVIGFGLVLFQMTATIRGMLRSPITTNKIIFIGMFIPILINSFTEFGIFGEANYGILFYQLLIWLVAIKYDTNYNRKQKIKLQKMRPEFYEKELVASSSN